MNDDIRDEELTPESKERLQVGKAEAKKIWQHVRDSITQLDEYAAYACLNDLVIMHVGYWEGRWPGSAETLIPVIMDSLKDDDDATEE